MWKRNNYYALTHKKVCISDKITKNYKLAVLILICLLKTRQIFTVMQACDNDKQGLRIISKLSNKRCPHKLFNVV